MTATVPVRWSKEPEKREWMLANAGGRPIAEVCGAFEERFGHPLKRSQVSLFRAEHDMQRRRGNRSAHRTRAAPIGAERVCKGYVMVKVRELPDKPQSKDNWRFKHVLAWERSRGLGLPRGWMVLFCDGDNRNFDAANLKAVPRQLIGVMNGGPRWHDRGSLEAAVALAMVKTASSAMLDQPRTCGVCGREFTPDTRYGMKAKQRQITCRECLDKGLRAPKDFGPRTCPECGCEFRARSPRSTYCCRECWEAAYGRRKDGS